MINTAIETPFQIFTDIDGTPLENGYIYVGEVNKNPEVHPVTIYIDKELTTPLAQPIITLGGYAILNGTPINFYADGDFSITIRDKNEKLVFTALQSTDFLSEYVEAILEDYVYSVDNISDLLALDITKYSSVNVKGHYSENDGGGGLFNYDASQTAINNGGTILDGWVRQYDDYINVKWFGAKGDGSDDSSAFDAVEAVVSLNELIFVPPGIYYKTSAVDKTKEYISGGGVSFLHQDTDGTVVRFSMNLSSSTGKSKFTRSLDNGRDELLIYANGDDYGTNSLGAGMHLYGNSDAQHAGNIALLTGQDDQGDARVIISGGSNDPTSEGYRTNTDTRVTIGDIIWDFVDNEEDIGLLNLKGSGDKPNIHMAGGTYDISTPYNFDFNVSKYDGAAHLNSFAYSQTGGLKLYDNNDGNDNTKFFAMYQTFDAVGTVEKIELRANQSLANGAGINLYGNNDASGGIIQFYTSGLLTLQLNDTGTRSVRPGVDGTQGLGTASTRWGTVYAAVGAINTSDDREKKYLNIEETELEVAKELKGIIKKFKFNDAIKLKGEDEARIHFGTSAQEVKSIFEKHGLIAEDYGMLCYDEWEDELDAGGKVIIEAGNRYGIRYEEFICFIMSAM